MSVNMLLPTTLVLSAVLAAAAAGQTTRTATAAIPPTDFYAKVIEKHCAALNGTTYSGLTSAQVACNSTPACAGVYDEGCDNSGVFFLCRGPSTWQVAATSCIWGKTGTVPTPAPTTDVPTPAPTTPAPTPNGTLVFFGGTPDSSHLPLGTCQGDCDYDSDCQTGLLCFKRDDYEVVPGCQEGGSDDVDGYDYCYDPASDPTTYEKITKKGCPLTMLDSSTTYPSLVSAETACNATGGCYGFFDSRCTGTDYQLCGAGAWSDDSSSGSCVYENPNPTAETTAAPTTLTYTKVNDAQCSDTQLSAFYVYSTLIDAENACNTKADCHGVYDLNCDSSNYYLCGAPSGGTWASSSMSCVYAKPDLTSTTAAASTVAAPTTTSATASISSLLGSGSSGAPSAESGASVVSFVLTSVFATMMTALLM